MFVSLMQDYRGDTCNYRLKVSVFIRVGCRYSYARSELQVERICDLEPR